MIKGFYKFAPYSYAVVMAEIRDAGLDNLEPPPVISIKISEVEFERADFEECST